MSLQGAAVAAEIAARLQLLHAQSSNSGKLVSEERAVASDAQRDEAKDIRSTAVHKGFDHSDGQREPQISSVGDREPGGECGHQDAGGRKWQGGLKFVIIGSGYELRTPEHSNLRRCMGVVEMPSLHVYRSCGDRQVSSAESTALLHWFSPQGRQVMNHSKGHTLPADKVSVSHVRSFLRQFL